MKPVIASFFGLAIGTACYADNLENHAKFWYQAGSEAIARTQAIKPVQHKAKNVILFVGDGMGISTITAARILEGQSQAAHRGGEEHSLSFERMPYLALSKTYSVNQQTSDSAPTMSAIITGVKTNDRMLSVDAGTQHGEPNADVLKSHRVKTLIEQAEEHGLATGIVTTTRITHATPAACYAHSPERDWESDAQIPASAHVADIASQLLDFPYGDGLEVALGGGRAMFLPKTQADPEEPGQYGLRKDGQDLTQRWLNRFPNSAYVFDRQGFDSIDSAKVEHLLGLFASSHMAYEHDRAKDLGGEPSLSEMTAKAIEVLQKNPKGFVLMVEAGRIDHAHHAGNAFRALHDTIELSNAVQTALNKTSAEDTLMIVTADHSHTFTIAGYPQRGNPILGLVQEAEQSKTATDRHGHSYTTLSYANGPGHRETVQDDDEHPAMNTDDPEYLQAATVPLASETHAGEDVAIFANGPQAHWFHGIQEQSYIYQVMARALGFEPGR